MTEHDPYLDRLLKWLVVAATIFLVTMAVALIAKPGSASAAPAPKAHSSIVWGQTVCGYWYRQAVYIPCRWAYAKKRVRDYRNLFTAEPWRRDYRYIYMSLATTGDYGPNTWYSNFCFVYNEPAFKQVRRYRGRMIISARTGKAVRVSRGHSVKRC